MDKCGFGSWFYIQEWFGWDKIVSRSKISKPKTTKSNDQVPGVSKSDHGERESEKKETELRESKSKAVALHLAASKDMVIVLSLQGKLPQPKNHMYLLVFNW